MRWQRASYRADRPCCDAHGPREKVVTKSLDDTQLSELLTEMARSDTVELKLTVADSGYRSAVDALDLDPLQAQMRQVIFFDTPSLDLYTRGVVVRSRRIQGGAGDTVVKLRPLPKGLNLGKDRRPKGLTVEVDAMPGGFICSGSIKGPTTAEDVRAVAVGRAKIGRLFSKTQKTFFAQHAPSGLRLKDLSVLGPITLLKLKFNPKTLGRAMVAELWLYPDGSKILELSTKCAPTEAFQVAALTRAYLTDHGIDLTAEQQTKTRTALKYFAARAAKGAEETEMEPATP
jgi:hypothetical protein